MFPELLESEDIIMGFESLYDPEQLQPIKDLLTTLVGEFVQARVYTQWILGLQIAIFSLLIVIIFSVFFSNYK